MAGSFDDASRVESWSPAVDRGRLRQMVRGELNRDEDRAVWRLIRTFDPWRDAFADAAAEEYRSWVASVTRWERFRYRVGNRLDSIRAFIFCRVWDVFPSLDPDNQPKPVDEWLGREIQRDFNETDGVKTCRKN